MAQSLYLSFTDYSLGRDWGFIGLDNFRRMMDSDRRTGDPQFISALRVTFTYVFVSVPLRLVFALGIAMLLNRSMRFLGLYRAVYYIPTLLGGSVAIAVLWRRLFARDGTINLLLETLGLDRFVMWIIGADTLPGWISNPNYALGTLIILAVWQFGSSMIIFLAGLKNIPTEFSEAASIDGAGKIKQFFTITLPLLTPVVLFNLVMQIIGAFQAFTQAYIISGGLGGPVKSTLFYTLHLYNQGFRYRNMGYASAMAWVLLIMIAVITGIIFKSSKTWVSYGSGE
jgi:multiple sugar transport system permease protein